MERRPTSNASLASLLGPRSLLSPRAVVLALTGLVIIGTAAIPMKQYLEQRDRLAILQAQVDENEATVARLQSEVNRWNDPAYVQSQVRKNLHWVMPGEIGFFVTASGDIGAVKQQFAITPTTRSDVWYSVLWNSINSAATTTAPAS